MSDTKLPKYNDVALAFRNLKALTESAEAHGLLCALFSAGADVRLQAWIDSMLSGHIEEGDVITEQSLKVLSQMFDATREQFFSGYYDLELLLPDDEEKFYMRIGSLAMWCQGFLSGLGLMEVDFINHPSKDVSEAVEDLAKMSRLQYDNEEVGNNEDETAYTELVEYAKLAALLLHSEFRVEKNAQK